ncbi:hypothetical protein [Methanobrevibacter woesei]|mgnify:CR=1 FL=1|uniref:hypothetical protein n=1 Tax=Methanobrevibacter woesei TaxID=190976 RepID=UPI0024B81BB9|nr:hypothetical protein [Methanobrevibacter woesei]
MDLTNIVTVELDESSIDSAISYCNSNPIFDELSDILMNMKADISTAAQEGVKLIAEENKASQELFIMINGSIVTGTLINSIIISQLSAYSYTIFPDVDYAWYVEKGRGEVRPVSANALHFFVGGSEVFTQYSGPAQPKPFVEPAFNQTEQKAVDIIDEAIKNVID